jgi:glutaredoxin
MKKFPVLVVLTTIIIIVGGALFFSRGNSENFPSLPSNYELFVSAVCPHCKNVEDFLNSWEKKDQVKINKLEVDSNQIAVSLLAKRASYCELPTNELGVPFLFTPEGKCLSGDQPIIEFLKNLQ